MEPSRLLDWTGKTCVIAASGPSLTDEQCSLVAATEVKVIAVNTTFKKFVAPDVVYACDYALWRHYSAELHSHCKGPKTQLWTQDRSSAERWNLNWVRQASRPGLGKKAVHVNGNSGFGAINLAYLFGCRRIILIGFDMKLGPKGEKHWHGNHPAPLTQGMQFVEWLHKSGQFARELKDEGVSVVNCTPGSALTCFKTASLEEMLR